MRLSVVVTIVDGGDALERCLNALATQQVPPPLEVIAPWDDEMPGISAFAARFPAVRFVPVVRGNQSSGSTADSRQHERFDRRRAAGLAAATGDLIAILEDRSVPRADWTRTLIRLHTTLPHAVIGGAIENGRDAILNWAVYFCDFGRYQRPFEPGPRQWVSDVNVGYKRRALEQTRAFWRERYHETTVHWALQRAGETLFLAPDLIVDQMRGELTWSALVRERFAWGRVFAYTRAREVGVPKRIALTVLAPLLPLLLFARLAALQAGKRVALAKFVLASPVVVVLLMAWSAGEAVGYVTGKP